MTLDVVDATGTHHKYKLQPKLDEKQGRYLIGFSPEVKTRAVCRKRGRLCENGHCGNGTLQPVRYDKLCKNDGRGTSARVYLYGEPR